MTLLEIKRTIDPNLLRRHHRLQEDYSWIYANKRKLRIKYANKYIAVENKEVKYVSDTIEEIVARIKQSDQQVEDFAIEYIGETEAKFLL